MSGKKYIKHLEKTVVRASENLVKLEAENTKLRELLVEMQQARSYFAVKIDPSWFDDVAEALKR